MDYEMKEILCITQEECAEVSQAISKIFRFGPDQMKYKENRTNREHLEEEVGDLLCMIDLMVERKIIDDTNVHEAMLSKKSKLQTWSNIFGENK